MALERVKRDLLHGRGTGFGHVVAGDGDRVPARDLLVAVSKDVADESERLLRRVDVGAARDVLLQHVVLDGPRELVAGDPVLLRDQLVEQQEHRARRVDGHRGRDLVERQPVEQDAHVVDRVDRHTDLADLAVRDRLVAVVAHLGRQVEGHAQAAGPGVDELVVPLVATPWPSRTRRTAASSTDGRCTSTHTRPGCTGTRPAPPAGPPGRTRRGRPVRTSAGWAGRTRSGLPRPWLADYRRRYAPVPGWWPDSRAGQLDWHEVRFRRLRRRLGSSCQSSCPPCDDDQAAEVDQCPQRLRDQVGLEHDLLPGEPQDEPPTNDQPVVAPAVPVERLARAMELEALRLDDDLQALVGEVDPRPEASILDRRPVARPPDPGRSWRSPAAPTRTGWPLAHRRPGRRRVLGRVPPWQRRAASCTSRGFSPARHEESNTASASSNGRSMQQSITVRTGVVTQPSTTASAARSRPVQDHRLPPAGVDLPVSRHGDVRDRRCRLDRPAPVQSGRRVRDVRRSVASRRPAPRRRAATHTGRSSRGRCGRPAARVAAADPNTVRRRAPQRATPPRRVRASTGSTGSASRVRGDRAGVHPQDSSTGSNPKSARNRPNRTSCQSRCPPGVRRRGGSCGAPPTAGRSPSSRRR